MMIFYYMIDKIKFEMEPEEIFKELAKRQSWTIHFSVDAYIDGKWIQCDTSFDQALVPFPYNWNGRTDLLLLCPWWRLGHLGKTPVLPADEINARFAERGFTKEFCMKHIHRSAPLGHSGILCPSGTSRLPPVAAS